MTEQIEARKYRSRKFRPCDACRRRRIGCIKEAGAEACTTCKVRDLKCTYEAAPTKRKQAESKTGKSPVSTHLKRIEVPPCLRDPELPYVKETFMKRHPSVSSTDSKDSLENHCGQTSVFVGFSGDRDPWLLRKVKFESNDSSFYRTPSDTDPIYFSVHPTEYLDSLPDKYSCDKINSVIYPHQKDLLGTFFEKINTSLPFINKCIFKRERTCSTLLAAIYTKAIQQKKRNTPSSSAELSRPEYLVRDFTVTSLPLEFASASLQTVQAALIHLQFDPVIIRDANCPHGWVYCAALVAICQQLGLHLEPSSWSIPVWEKRLRRRLWWATYVQDKWESMGLSRPSHIHDDDFSVAQAIEEDFVEDEDKTELDDSSSAFGQGVKIFIAMVHLSKVLSSLLKTFYSVNSIFNDNKDFDELMAHALHLIYQADSIEVIYFPKGKTSIALSGTLFSLKLAKTALTICCCKHVLYKDQQRAYGIFSPIAYKTVRDFVDQLAEVGVMQLNTNWWSYSRVNFSVVGMAILAFYISSDSKTDRDSWRAIAVDYKDCLSAISKVSIISHLALLRFESLFERIESVLKNPESKSIELSSVIDTRETAQFRKLGTEEVVFNDSDEFTEDDFFMDWLKSNEFHLLSDPEKSDS